MGIRFLVPQLVGKIVVCGSAGSDNELVEVGCEGSCDESVVSCKLVKHLDLAVVNSSLLFFQ